MSWLSWIAVGFLAGMGAKAATGRRGLGCIGTVVVGILGGLLGGILFKAAGDEGVNDFSIRSVLIAFVGACVLLLIFGARFSGRHRHHHRSRF